MLKVFDYLQEFCGKCPDELYDDKVSHDSDLFTSLKKLYLDDAYGYYNQLRQTKGYHSAALITRCMYSLLYHSQTGINDTCVAFDNCGLRDFLMLVRGGKKINNNQRSRFVRFIFRTSEITQFLNTGDSCHVIDMYGQKYVMTPWLQIDQKIVINNLTMLYNTQGYILMNMINKHRDKGRFSQFYQMTAFNYLLAYHERRTTEKKLHNMRYVIMNVLAEYSNF